MPPWTGDVIADALPAAGLPILVVDDDAAIIRTLSDILELHGYRPHTAATGGEGLRQAQRSLPALAVVDLRLPDMDGLELARRLHELSELTQVVVLTGNATMESAIAALREHSVDYLLKPVNVDHLLQVVSAAGERFQRRTVEVALRESEERYRMLFDRNPQPVWVVDRETLRFLAVNDAAVRHYGWSREEFLSMSVEAIRPEDDLPAFRAAAHNPANGVPRLWRHRTRAGKVIDVEITTHDIPFGGRPGRVVLANDVTERLAEERAMRRRAAQQAALTGFGDRALHLDDVDGLLADAAGTLARGLGVPVVALAEYRDGHAVVRAAHGLGEGARGRPIDVALGDAGERAGISTHIPGPVKPLGQIVARGAGAHEFTDDDRHFLGAMAHTVGTLMERSRTEHMMRQSQRLEAVGRLAGGVAHDFNNMLTAITGYAEMMMAAIPDADPLREDAQEILKAAGRAAALTKQLLAFSRQQVLQPRLVNLNDSVRDMENMLRRLIGEQVEMRVRLGGDLALTKADPGQLQQVILNLCVNARDAMPKGGTLTIETSNVDLDAGDGAQAVNLPGRYVMLAVRDTGTGMDAETRARIFEPFFSTKGDKGTGLGLPTVYGIVKQSGGEIWVDSEPGEGTVFKVFFPAVTGVEPTAIPPESRVAVEGGGTETVLLAEDEDPIRTLAHRVLTRAGYTVLLAGTGRDAARLAAEHEGEVDILVTDMVMPEGGGRELAAALRARQPALPVLYLSGYTESSVARKDDSGGGEGFLQKPFTTSALVAKVREMLNARRGAPQPLTNDAHRPITR